MGGRTWWGPDRFSSTSQCSTFSPDVWINKKYEHPEKLTFSKRVSIDTRRVSEVRVWRSRCRIREALRDGKGSCRSGAWHKKVAHVTLYLIPCSPKLTPTMEGLVWALKLETLSLFAGSHERSKWYPDEKATMIIRPHSGFNTFRTEKNFPH